MDLITALKKIGFTQQEAVIYIELCHHHEMTGYEAAKQSGISRSNAYAALSSLVDKGYAYVVEEQSAKYTPVPKDELMINARRDFESNMRIIDEKLNFTTLNQEPYVTIKGEKHVVDKLKNIITQAELRLYVSGDDEVIKAVEKELRHAADRGLKVVVLSQNPVKDMTHQHYFSDGGSSLKLIADTKEVLAGTLDQSLYSKNGTLVQLIREAFINEITLLENNQHRNR